MEESCHDYKPPRKIKGWNDGRAGMRLAGDLDGRDGSERLLQVLEFCHHFRVGMTIYTH
jgi:hypothetical protein